MADQVGPLLEQRRELVGLELEIDLFKRGVRRIATAVRDDVREPSLEWLQRAPGGGAVADAPVHEDDPQGPILGELDESPSLPPGSEVPPNPPVQSSA